ncbi:MAG: TnpV protein [Coprococcus catus]|nr:TnpV protein [Coprococcus catus]
MNCKWCKFGVKNQRKRRIGEHLLEVDKAAREREEIILKQLEEKEPLPDKEKDQMAWVRADYRSK